MGTDRGMTDMHNESNMAPRMATGRLSTMAIEGEDSTAVVGVDAPSSTATTRVDRALVKVEVNVAMLLMLGAGEVVVLGRTIEAAMMPDLEMGMGGVERLDGVKAERVESTETSPSWCSTRALPDSVDGGLRNGHLYHHVK